MTAATHLREAGPVPVVAPLASDAMALAPRWWAPALLAAERTDRTGPGWVRLCEDVFARADTVPAAAHTSCSDSRTSAELVFAPVVAPFVDAAIARLAGHADAGLVANLAGQLSAALCRLATRTLVAELHRQLGGAGTAADVTAVIACTATGTGLRALATRYPVLMRLLATAASHRVDAHAELLGRHCADRSAIVARFLDGRDPGAVVAITVGVGDTHRRGRSVCVLAYADGRRLVYKPRALHTHALLNELLATAGLLDDAVPAGLHTAAVLARPGYGWMQFVPPAPCPDRAGVETYYRRQGVLLAVLHALRTTDLHAENILATGDRPVAVDLETLLHPDLALPPAGDPARAALDASVLRTAMLPRHGSGPDMSGIAGGAPRTGEAVDYLDAGLPTMRLVRRPRTAPAAHNRPVLAGRIVPADQHVDAVVAGFRAGYDAVLRARTELLAPDGVVARLTAEPTRVVLRNTSTYARLLDECTHPDVLGDAAARDAVLRRLAEQAGPAGAAVIDAEVRQLWHGDVPVFRTHPPYPGVVAADDEDVPGRSLAVAETDAPSSVRAAIGRLSLADRERQAWIIAAALSTPGTAPRSGRARAAVPAGAAPGGAAPVTGSADVLGAALAIGDRLIADAHDDGRRANWLTRYPRADGTASVLPMGADLASGFPGVAVFLAQLARSTGSARHRACARRACADLGTRVEQLAEDPAGAALIGPGGHLGAGGIGYAVARLADLVPESGLGGVVDAAVELIARSAGTGTPLGLADGYAGGLLSLLALAATGHSRAGDLAWHWSDLLLRADAPAGTGLGDGAAGVALALFRAGRAFDRPELVAAASALAHRDPPDSPPSREPDFGALSGLAGRALVAAEVEPDSFLARRLADLLAVRFDDVAAGDAADPTTPGGTAGNDSLATGEAGVLEVVLATAPPSGLVFEQLALVRAASAGPDALRCGTPGAVPVAGLLHGLAGIGHTLLRLADPSATPSALLLATDPSTPLPGAGRPIGLHTQ